MEFLTLNGYGFVGAVVFGALILFFGLGMGPYFLILMLYFLALSAVVTAIGKRYKKSINQYERFRTIRNVIANGAWPLIMSIAFYFSAGSGSVVLQIAIFVGFVSAVAGVAADKFSSEIGIMDGKPLQLVSFKRVKKGISGGVTALGLGAGLFGAFLISATVFLLKSGLVSNSSLAVVAFACALVGGFLGTIFDSVLGYYESKGIGNKFTSNFFGSAFGSIAAMLIFAAVI
ncbi:MAG: DUF92 domain-containing protein [Candidatus Micrarchaeales archaeon]|jgi:uncharacterized protein (TIGR00297 family)|uniref:DUF92 domain-containing protein n=1 Tax=Candidatus Micrarchaeum acidiphilum ARMAN-2 TaxID=425595 RepID=C7DIB5_MICA2|nr:MAG: protein of unknown function DUF92 transmembrane [Candidatus Micrarchaeum acidiphilum ARMAN-2]MCW6160940.1 DUF92 domain-containing protein [Candidatus Micrarchaeales archaeon]